MKEQGANLIGKRAELKQFIDDSIGKAIPAYFFDAVGNVLTKLFRLKKQPHWIVNAAILGIFGFLPGILIALITGEIFQWGELHLFFAGLALFAYFSPITSHLNLTYNVMPGLRDNIVDSIQSVEDLDRFHKWLGSLLSTRAWLLVSICISIPYMIIIIMGESLAVGKFIGFGITVTNCLLVLLFDSPLYFIFKILVFPPQLANYQLNLYESDPANSEVVQRLIYILNVYLYILAGYIALLTALVALHPSAWAIWLVILLGWLPTIMQFLVNQYAIRKIIISAKWHRLNRLQEQIQELQDGNLKDVEDKTIARINQLMDLHDRISARPNSILNWGTSITFLNQLMLPLLGLLLGNIDKLLKLLTRTP